MKQIRAFVAVNVPLALVDRIGAAQQQLRKQTQEAGMKVVWVPQPNMHITLKFLGNMVEENGAAVSERLHQLLEGAEPLQLKISGLGGFPDLEQPRVLWAGVKSNDERLAQLAKDVDQALTELGFAEEKRPFSGHITIGRVKTGKGGEEGASGIEAEFGQCTINEVVLYKSELQRAGAEYTPLARIPFAVKS